MLERQTYGYFFLTLLMHAVLFLASFLFVVADMPALALCLFLHFATARLRAALVLGGG